MEKIKYEKPVIINLGEKVKGRGDCTASGSGDSVACWTGLSASGGGCGLGNSAIVSGCGAGTAPTGICTQGSNADVGMPGTCADGNDTNLAGCNNGSSP